MSTRNTFLRRYKSSSNYHNELFLLIHISAFNNLPPPALLSCSIIREFVKNGRSEGFGVDPIDKLSMSGPESSPSQHDSDSSSWKSASKSRSPRRAAVPRLTSPSNSSDALKRFSKATIFCLKLRCCNEIVCKRETNWKRSEINSSTIYCP